MQREDNQPDYTCWRTKTRWISLKGKNDQSFATLFLLPDEKWLALGFLCVEIAKGSLERTHWVGILFERKTHYGSHQLISNQDSKALEMRKDWRTASVISLSNEKQRFLQYQPVSCSTFVHQSFSEKHSSVRGESSPSTCCRSVWNIPCDADGCRRKD